VTGGVGEQAARIRKQAVVESRPCIEVTLTTDLRCSNGQIRTS